MLGIRPFRLSLGKLTLAAVLVVAVLGLAWGLTSAVASSPAPTSSNTSVVLRLGWTREPDNLNVFIGYVESVYEIWALNYDYVFGLGDNNQPTLDLATQFPTQQNGGISPDGKVWTIHIRSGVRFDDGTPLTAADVAFTYNYVIKNQMANYLNYVAGIKTVRELNPTTVQFICARPMAVGYMETLSVPIVPKHIWEHVSPQAAITSYGDKPPIIGSGPFETVAFVKGSYVEMVRNPYYWGKKPTIDKIYFEMYENPETMVQDLKAGRIDGAWGIPPADFTDLKSVKGIKTVAHPYYDWDYLEFNCYDKPTSLGNPVLLDWRFRNALNYAINKPLLAKLAYDGYAEPATTIINPGTWVNPDYHWQPPANEAYAFDLAKANQLLTAAGYPLRNGVRLNKQGKPIVLRLMASTDSPGAQVEAKLITGWLQQLGLTIKLSMIDGGTLLSDIYNAHGSGWAPDFDMVVSWWTGYYDPGVTLDCFTAAGIGSLNEPYWVNPTYDTLATEQGSTVDTSRRQAIIYQMQQLMYQQTPWIPLTYPDNLEAFNTAKWTGWLQLWGTGPAWNCEGNITSYLDLRPIVSTTSSSSSSTSAVTAVIVVVVVVAAVVVFVLMRRRRHVTEEA